MTYQELQNSILYLIFIRNLISLNWIKHIICNINCCNRFNLYEWTQFCSRATQSVDPFISFLFLSESLLPICNVWYRYHSAWLECLWKLWKLVASRAHSEQLVKMWCKSFEQTETVSWPWWRWDDGLVIRMTVSHRIYHQSWANN